MIEEKEQKEYENLQQEQLKAFKIKELEKQNRFMQRVEEAKDLRQKQVDLQRRKKEMEAEQAKMLEASQVNQIKI